MLGLHTDEIPANVVESLKFPIRLHIYVSTQTPNLGSSPENNTGFQGVALPSVIT